ncbi:AIG2-like protein D, partial [Cucurbita argyrosperma subsp. sororia]
MDSASLASLAPSHTPQNLHRVFVYGSLLSDEVVHILLKRTPQSSAAVLNDLFFQGLTATELDILDAFEDVEYKRESTVEVSFNENSIYLPHWTLRRVRRRKQQRDSQRTKGFKHFLFAPTQIIPSSLSTNLTTCFKHRYLTRQPQNSSLLKSELPTSGLS